MRHDMGGRARNAIAPAAAVLLIGISSLFLLAAFGIAFIRYEASWSGAADLQFARHLERSACVALALSFAAVLGASLVLLRWTAPWTTRMHRGLRLPVLLVASAFCAYLGAKIVLSSSAVAGLLGTLLSAVTDWIMSIVP